MAGPEPIPIAPTRDLPCPACDYPIPASIPRCSECGYEPTPEDRAFSERRMMFLELTRFSGFGWILAFAVICLAVSGTRIVFALLISALIAWKLIAAGLPKNHRRLARRVWLVSLPGLVFPTLVLAVAGSMLPWDIAPWSNGFGNIPPRWLSLHSRGMGGVTVPILMLATALIPYGLWRLNWRRLGRIAGLSDSLLRLQSVQKAARWTMLPVALVAAMTLLAIGVPQILDAAFPGWDMGK